MNEKELTVQIGPVLLTMPCSDNQSLQYEQANEMLEMVMKQFRDEFSGDVVETDMTMNRLNIKQSWYCGIISSYGTR